MKELPGFLERIPLLLICGIPWAADLSQPFLEKYLKFNTFCPPWGTGRSILEIPSDHLDLLKYSVPSCAITPNSAVVIVMVDQQ